MADATVGVHWVQGVGQSNPWSPPEASPRDYPSTVEIQTRLINDVGAPTAHHFSLCERKKSNQKKVAQLNHPSGSLSAASQSGGIKNSSSFAKASLRTQTVLSRRHRMNRLCSVLSYGIFCARVSLFPRLAAPERKWRICDIDLKPV